MTALLVTGAAGQLGTELVAVAAGAPGVSAVHGLSSAELDITDGQRVCDAVAAFAARHPGAVLLNAAAYTAVDEAETEADRAYAVNALGPGLLAAACAERGVPLIHVSTDYVFAGDAVRPYEVTDPTGPRTASGRTKLAGERAVLSASGRGFVVRTAWVYGAHGSNFVRTLAGLERRRDTVSVVDDQCGSPTWSADLARGLVALALAVAVRSVPPGILHCTNSGSTTWCGLARAVFAELGADPGRVRPCTSAEFPRPAARPRYSVLSPASWVAAGLTPLRPWRDALAAHLSVAAGGAVGSAVG